MSEPMSSSRCSIQETTILVPVDGGILYSESDEDYEQKFYWNYT